LHQQPDAAFRRGVVRLEGPWDNLMHRTYEIIVPMAPDAPLRVLCFRNGRTAAREHKNWPHRLPIGAVAANVLARPTADFLSVVVTLSIMATPLLLLIDDAIERGTAMPPPRYDALPPEDGHVVIAGFGRFGEIAARILRAKRIRFTALDASAEHVDIVKQYGSEIYYGDASRLDILRAARTDKARAFVLAIDDVEASLRTAEIVRRHFPHVPLYARARNRQHALRLLDLGAKVIRREAHDEQRLFEDYKHSSDAEKIRIRAQTYAEELERIFVQDAEAQEKLARAAEEKS
jgi:voltage-gated potassium channel Kch